MGQRFLTFVSICTLIFCLQTGVALGQMTVHYPETVISEIPVDITLQSNTIADSTITIWVNDEAKDAVFKDGQALVSYTFNHEGTYQVRSDSEILGEKLVDPIPLWLSILPPLIAIIMALAFREVVSSLFLGLLFGAIIPSVYGQGWTGLFTGFLEVLDHYILEAVKDEGHLSIIIFSMLIGAMVSVISKNGGMRGVVNRISKYANSPKSGQLATWFLGIAIFFDDYANTLVVGNTMQPVTDRLKVSREKLSYIVDSTAAPIAAIAFVTTWIGAEIGYIQSCLEHIPEMGAQYSAFGVFFHSLAYSFYPIFTLIFMLFLIVKGRDFGPMLTAERKARSRNDEAETDITTSDELKQLEPDEGTPFKAYNAVIPVVSVILVTIVGLFYTGWDQSVIDDATVPFGRKLAIVIGNADSYAALLWSSMTGLLIAVVLTLSGRIMNIHNTISSAIDGFKTMLPAILILILAWALAAVTETLHTADFLTSLLSDAVQPGLFPVITFILAGIVAFSTGSSWGTMAILYPIMLPMAWTIAQVNGLAFDEAAPIFFNVVSCILSGAVLGDHCSPISDTTILSSLASSCNHIEHVRTQLPYALTVGAVSILIGTLPAGYGFSSYLSLPIGILILYFLVIKVGKKV